VQDEKDRLTYAAMLEKVDRDGVGLTDWEINFVESLSSQRARGEPISEKQKAALERIFDDRC